MKKQNNRLQFLALMLLLGILLSSFTSCDAFEELISGDGGFDPWDEKYFENQDDDFYEKYAVGEGLASSLKVQIRQNKGSLPQN